MNQLLLNRTKKIRTKSVRSYLRALFLIGLIVLSANVFSQKKIKIGYVGNNITQKFHDPKYDPPGYEGYLDISDLLIKQYFGDVVDIQSFGNGGAFNDPIKWILEGSKDDKTWVPIDSVGFDENVVLNQIFEKNTFKLVIQLKMLFSD